MMSKKDDAGFEAFKLGEAAGAALREVKGPGEFVLTNYFSGVLKGFNLKPSQEISVLSVLASIAPRAKAGDFGTEAMQVASLIGERFADQGDGRVEIATCAVHGLIEGLGLTTKMAERALARVETNQRHLDPNENDPELS